MIYWIGQGFGLLALFTNVIASVYKKKWQMLLNLVALNLFTMLNYLLIGQIGSAVWLYVVAMVQSGVALIHLKKDTKPGRLEIAVFFLLYVSLGLLGIVSAPDFVAEWSGKNLLELVPVAGAVCSMITIFVRDEQKSRCLILLTSFVWMFYAAMVGAASFFSEAACAVTTVVCLIRYRKKRSTSV